MGTARDLVVGSGFWLGKMSIEHPVREWNCSPSVELQRLEFRFDRHDDKQESVARMKELIDS